MQYFIEFWQTNSYRTHFWEYVLCIFIELLNKNNRGVKVLLCIICIIKTNCLKLCNCVFNVFLNTCIKVRFVFWAALVLVKSWRLGLAWLGDYILKIGIVLINLKQPKVSGDKNMIILRILILWYCLSRFCVWTKMIFQKKKFLEARYRQFFLY